MTSTQQPALSVQVFGEETSLPITVTKALIRATEPIPFVQKASVHLQLHLTNETVERDVVAKLKLALPIGASVKKFELQRNDQWYPATAVPKQKAKAVVYKEKEKGRAVAAVSNSAVATNVFEMEISPLPYKKETLCRLEILTNGDSNELVERLRASTGTQVQVEKLPSPASLSSTIGAVVGASFGKTHFVCQVPSIGGASNATNPLGRVAIFWDSSASMKEGTQQRCSRLLQLFETAGTSAVELYAFGIGPPEKIGSFQGTSAKEISSAIQAISHDGGTDLTVLPEAIAQLTKRGDEKAVDAVLVFTDGMDSLGRAPQFGPDIPFPVHCIADTSSNVNLAGLRTIAAASVNKPGVVLTKNSNNYLEGIFFQQPILQSIVVNQDEDAFMEETNDGFCCVPDHRLKTLNQPIPSDGIQISGILGDTVTKLTAVVVLGSQTHKFHYKLRAVEQCQANKMMFSDETKEEAERPVTDHLCPAVFLEDSPASRILGHVYAEQVYRQVEAFGIKSGLSAQQIKEDLAIGYGFCSPESTLLMLYEPEQFEEHGIKPAVGHPAAKDVPPKEEEEHKYAEGAVGGLKNVQQRQEVVALAKRMRSFFAENEEPKTVFSGGRMMRSMDMSSYVGEWEECEEEECDMAYDMARIVDGGNVPRDGTPFSSCSFSATPGVSREAYNMALSMGGGGGGAEDEEEEECEQEQECAMACNISPFSSAMEMFSGPGLTTGSGVSRERTNSQTNRQANDEEANMSAPNDPKPYMNALDKVLSVGGSGDAWKEEYKAQLGKAGDHGSASPSFFLNVARVLIRHKKPLEAIRVAANCLETGLEDVQLFRSVGYVLLSAETSYGLDLALQLFEKIRELAPLEPQSFLDISLALFWKSWKHFQNHPDGTASEMLSAELKLAQQGLVHVLTHTWASRFAEVEWPVLVLLHYIRDLIREVNKSTNITAKLDEWPPILGDDNGTSLIVDEFDPALMVWLGWDTDRTDVDLHVVEPSTQEVYYGNKRGKGSLLSRDFTQGYGPEVYIAKQGMADSGAYNVHAKYYASHQDSALTGTTSVVIWTIEKKGDQKHLKFDFLRLDTHKQKTLVGTATVEGPK